MTAAQGLEGVTCWFNPCGDCQVGNYATDKPLAAFAVNEALQRIEDQAITYPDAIRRTVGNVACEYRVASDEAHIGIAVSRKLAGNCEPTTIL